MHRLLLAVLPIILVGLSACQQAPRTGPAGSPTPFIASTPTPNPSPAAVAEPGMTVTPSGLQYQEIEVGDGLRPLFNQIVRVRYSGWLTDGVKFDSNIDDDEGPLEFKVGRGEVIKGWDMGIGGGAGIPPMRVGGRRKLIIPPQLGYGSQANGTLPANSTLIFDVTLVGIKR